MDVSGQKIKLGDFSVNHIKELKKILKKNKQIKAVEIRCKDIQIEGFLYLANILPEHKNISHLIVKQARSYTNHKIFGYSVFFSKVLPNLKRLTINAEKTTSKIMLYSLQALKSHNLKRLDLGAIGWGDLAVRRKIKIIFNLDSLESLSFGETVLKEVIAAVDLNDPKIFKKMRKTTLITTRVTSSIILPFFLHAKDTLALFIKPFPRNEVPGVRAILSAMERGNPKNKVRMASFHRYEHEITLLEQILPGQFSRSKIFLQIRDQTVTPSVIYSIIVRHNCRPNELWAEFQHVSGKVYDKRYNFRLSITIDHPLLHSHPLDYQGINTNATINYGDCLKRRG